MNEQVIVNGLCLFLAVCYVIGVVCFIRIRMGDIRVEQDKS